MSTTFAEWEATKANATKLAPAEKGYKVERYGMVDVFTIVAAKPCEGCGELHRNGYRWCTKCMDGPDADMNKWGTD